MVSFTLPRDACLVCSLLKCGTGRSETVSFTAMTLTERQAHWWHRDELIFRLSIGK